MIIRRQIFDGDLCFVYLIGRSYFISLLKFFSFLKEVKEKKDIIISLILSNNVALHLGCYFSSRRQTFFSFCVNNKKYKQLTGTCESSFFIKLSIFNMYLFNLLYTIWTCVDCITLLATIIKELRTSQDV